MDPMDIPSSYYDELQTYINEKKWDYATRVIKQSGILSILGENTKNVWFHYLSGLAYYHSGHPIGVLIHMGAFLNMASDRSEMMVNNQRHGIKVPTLEDMDRARKMLEAAKKSAAELLADEPGYGGNQEKINQEINKYQNTFGAQKSQGGCFIATAVYGSSIEPEVLAFRRFRDEILANSKVGLLLVRFYYLISPTLARLISKHTILSLITRSILLDPFLKYLDKKFLTQQTTTFPTKF